jgi:uncharacterized membrane protein YeaQ/YmgE (transglycosylase-associated protein family)
MSIGETIQLGIAGTFIGGLFSWYVLHGRGTGLLISIAFAMVLLIIRRMSLRRRNY